MHTAPPLRGQRLKGLRCALQVPVHGNGRQGRPPPTATRLSYLLPSKLAESRRRCGRSGTPASLLGKSLQAPVWVQASHATGALAASLYLILRHQDLKGALVANALLGGANRSPARGPPANDRKGRRSSVRAALGSCGARAAARGGTASVARDGLGAPGAIGDLGRVSRLSQSSDDDRPPHRPILVIRRSACSTRRAADSASPMVAVAAGDNAARAIPIGLILGADRNARCVRASTRNRPTPASTTDRPTPWHC